MSEPYVVRVYWFRRDDGVSGTAAALHGWLAALAEIDAALGGWRHRDEARGIDHPLVSRTACEEALERSAVKWRSGDREHTSYQAFFSLAGGDGASISLTCGLRPMALEVFAPNRLELTLASREWTEPVVVQAVLRKAVEAFRPDFGWAGTRKVPAPPLPVLSPGVPPVGWMTYLSAAYPVLPPFVSPVVVGAVGGQGAIIVAVPTRFRPKLAEHAEAVARVRAALESGGVLLPARALPRA